MTGSRDHGRAPAATRPPAAYVTGTPDVAAPVLRAASGGGEGATVTFGAWLGKAGIGSAGPVVARHDEVRPGESWLGKARGRAARFRVRPPDAHGPRRV